MLGRPTPKRELPSTPFSDGYLKGVFEQKQYGKTKAEREHVRINGPKRYRFDGENTMDKFTSEHPVQMSQDTFRAVMEKAKNIAPMKFVKSEEQITIGDISGNMRNAHLNFVPKAKSLPISKRDFEHKSQRRLLQACLKEHEQTWDQEFQAAFARRQARIVKPKAQKILDLQKQRAAIVDQILDNDQETIDLMRRRREKKLRPRRSPTGHANFRRFQTSNQSLIFKHDGGRRRRAQTAVTKFRFKKTFNTTYADRLAREKFISKANF